jgi:spoIIIJ-associated protein
MLRQALANLLGNAIKFTRGRDPAVIEVGRRDEPAAGGGERIEASSRTPREGERRGRRGRGGQGRGGPREGASAEPRMARDSNRHPRNEPMRHEPPKHEAPRHETARHEGPRHEGPRHEPRERRPYEHGAPAREHEGGAPPVGPPDPALDEQARELAHDLFDRMGFEAKVVADAAGEVVNVKVEVAADEELLIGKKGEVRQALQQLLNRMLNKGERTRYHLHLEVNDFWQRRETELADMARQLADEASESGRELLTEYLNAQERRVVHVALREDTRVKTYAIGDGLIKKVAIAPAETAGAPRE